MTTICLGGGIKYKKLQNKSDCYLIPSPFIVAILFFKELSGKNKQFGIEYGNFYFEENIQGLSPE